MRVGFIFILVLLGIVLALPSTGQETGYSKSNQYTANSLNPSCTPGSKTATCSSPDDCVDCKSKCWTPGNYNSGTFTCSQGKWTLSGYSKSNQYTANSLNPSCTPGSKTATCSSPDDCVDCKSKCWTPGNYNSGTFTCSQGKWTLSGYSKSNQYTANSLNPSCTPGSKTATCSSPDDCVDCKSKCWTPGNYNSGTFTCSQGKWTLKNAAYPQNGFYEIVVRNSDDRIWVQNAEVFIDGKFVGKTSFDNGVKVKVGDISPGSHRVRAKWCCWPDGLNCVESIDTPIDFKSTSKMAVKLNGKVKCLRGLGAEEP